MTFANVGQELEEYLDAPVSLIIFGDPGAGKTTAIAQIAQDCLWVVSSRKELRGYASWLKMRRGLAQSMVDKKLELPPDLERDMNRTMPAKVCELSEFQKGLVEVMGDDKKAPPAMLSQRIENKQMVEVIVDAYLKRLTREPNAYAGIVFSAWSIIAKRIHDDLSASMPNGWDVGKELHKFHRWLMREVPQVAGKSLILDMHKREPDFNKNGVMTHMGGPQLPTGPLAKPVAGEADFVFEYKKEIVETGDKMDGTFKKEERRVWITAGDDLTIRKSRDFRIQPIETGTLEEVLAKADVVIK